MGRGAGQAAPRYPISAEPAGRLAGARMEIKVNGEPHNLQTPATLLQLLESLNLPSLDRGVAVCVNGEIVRKNEWAATALHPDDELEIVHATQGG
jgi:sulfur carrier protein